MKSIGAFLVLLAVAWPCAAETLTGSGHAAHEERSVAGFDGIAVSVPSHVEVLQGDREGLAITADDNVLPRIEASVEHGVLRIRFPHDLQVRTRTPIELTVHARKVESISLAGAVRLEAQRLNAGDLVARVSGSGQLVLPDLAARSLAIHASGHCHAMASGKVESFELRVAGAGEINAARLEERRAAVRISGSAQAVVWVHENLSASITGAGAVHYFGDAAVEKRVVGSGRVARLGAAPP
jgi:hypothetical protein